MSKAVLISIRPKWCEKIIDGEKTIEVRKTRPKLAPPFKCYIYCTLQGSNEFFHDDLGGDVAKWNRGKWWDRKGKVIGEFTCDRIDMLTRTKSSGEGIPEYNTWEGDIGPRKLFRIQPAAEVFRAACLSEADAGDYLKGRLGYSWHISGLKTYDTPRELGELRRACPNSWYCESCAMYWENNGACGNESLQIKRAPQSWCYMEEET